MKTLKCSRAYSPLLTLTNYEADDPPFSPMACCVIVDRYLLDGPAEEIELSFHTKEPDEKHVVLIHKRDGDDSPWIYVDPDNPNEGGPLWGSMDQWLSHHFFYHDIIFVTAKELS